MGWQPCGCLWLSGCLAVRLSGCLCSPAVYLLPFSLAYAAVDRSRFNCQSVFGSPPGCQQVFAPDKANFKDMDACEASGCASCREKTCHSHGNCSTVVTGCICDPNYYPSSSCSVYCDPASTCHGHGKCGDAGACECDANYYPAGNCTTFCNAEETCHGNGKCGDKGACECDGHYLSPDSCEHSVMMIGAAAAGVISLVVVRGLCLSSVLVPAALGRGALNLVSLCV